MLALSSSLSSDGQPTSDSCIFQTASYGLHSEGGASLWPRSKWIDRASHIKDGWWNRSSSCSWLWE